MQGNINSETLVDQNSTQGTEQDGQLQDGQLQDGQNSEVQHLYAPKEEAGMEALPNRGVQSLSEPQVRTHGAASMSESTYAAGYVVSGALIVLAFILIVFAKGARKRDSLDQLWNQKQAHSVKVKNSQAKVSKTAG